MRKVIGITLAVLFAFVINVSAQKISILGDSYSTYSGYISPEWNYTWYGENGSEKAKNNDVKDVEQTWWRILAKDMGYTIEKNNSFSGSTVCYTGYGKNDYSDRSFLTRMPNLGNPDIIFVFGGTNDSWAKAPVGNYLHEGWSRRDLYSFRPAFCYMMYYLKKNYPDARIVNICNSELSAEVTETQEVVCKYYGITNVLLHDINKQWGHPSIAGMQAISEQIKAAIQ